MILRDEPMRCDLRCFVVAFIFFCLVRVPIVCNAIERIGDGGLDDGMTEDAMPRCVLGSEEVACSSLTGVNLRSKVCTRRCPGMCRRGVAMFFVLFVPVISGMSFGRKNVCVGVSSFVLRRQEVRTAVRWMDDCVHRSSCTRRRHTRFATVSISGSLKFCMHEGCTQARAPDGATGKEWYSD